jgi:hypothetical protein
MFFLFWFGFCFGFSGVFIVVPVHVRKRKGRLKPATTAQFFLIASGRAVKNPLAVLEFAADQELPAFLELEAAIQTDRHSHERDCPKPDEELGDYR